MRASSTRSIHECGPLVIPGAFSPTEVQALRDHLDRTYREPQNVASVYSHLQFGSIDAAEVPTEFHARLRSLADQAGDHFGLEAPFVNPTVLRYRAGSIHPGHKDRNECVPGSLWITLSLSILLSDPEDFPGGVFETFHDGPVDVGLGDAIATTSETRHRVRAIEAGQRYVLVAFCGAAHHNAS